jgi:hypothetical protein
LGAIESDQDLIKHYLVEWFKDVEHNDVKEFAEYLDNTWLDQLLAEVKITSGTLPEGKEDGWLINLGATAALTLKNRVDLSFTDDNPRNHGAADDVKLELMVKNVKSMLVKLFKINARSYYRSKQREVDTSVPLDGLTPHEESTVDYSDTSPYRLVKRTLTFPSLKVLLHFAVDHLNLL